MWMDSWARAVAKSLLSMPWLAPQPSHPRNRSQSLHLKCAAKKKNLKRSIKSWKTWSKMTMRIRSRKMRTKASAPHSLCSCHRKQDCSKMLYRAKRKKKDWTWSLKVLAVLISMWSWELPIASTAGLRASRVWLSKSRSPTTRRKSPTRAPPWKTRNCKEKPLSAVRRTRLSSMSRWLKKWRDKNSHLTLAPHHTARKLFQCKIHYLLESK